MCNFSCFNCSMKHVASNVFLIPTRHKENKVTSKRIVIGAENKPGETRRAITPTHAKKLKSMGYHIVAQSFPKGTFPDLSYQNIGIPLIQETEPGDLVVGTKEFKPQESVKGIKENQVLLGFHHAHKGQAYNMEMLQAALQNRASLFDYELYRTNCGTQPVTTSPHAGMAGAYNGICAYLKAQNLNHPTPQFFGVYQKMLDTMRKHLSRWNEIRILVVGSGGCGQGACKFLSDLGITENHGDFTSLRHLRGPWFKVLSSRDVFRNANDDFETQEYRISGKEKYSSIFNRYIGYHDLMIHCPYWDDRFPQLMPESMFDFENIPVISDVTCDLFPNGSLACTRRENTIRNWVTRFESTWVTAVDCLPTQIAKTCSKDMSSALMELVPKLMEAAWNNPLEQSGLSPDIQRGFLVWNGEIAEHFREDLATRLEARSP
jgi:alanine dehydrogenase